MDKWINPGRYVSGKELATAGLAEMLSFEILSDFTIAKPSANGRAHRGSKVKQRK
jgi:hypothetical protein